jgi:hypothetical protein
MAVSDAVGFTFVLLCPFLVVMTVKSLSSAISSSLGGSEEALADNAGFCAPWLTAVVSLWDQCTSAATVTL